MVKNPQRLKVFQNNFHKNEGPVPFSHSLKIFTSLWNEGIKLGVLPLKRPLEGIETDIKIARIRGRH
jgi:hypothetical protein